MIRSIRNVSALALLGFGVLAHAEVAVIVNAGASATPSKSDVANIFLGKDKSLKGIDQKNWTPTKEKFYADVTSKNEAQLRSYWSGLVFSGKGQLLPGEDSDAAIVAKVAAQADAIGYVDSAAVNDSVKVILRLP